MKVDTRAGEIEGTVIDCSTVAVDKLDFYFNLTNATKPLRRVLARVIEKKFEYPEETVEEFEDEQDNTDQSDC